MAEAPSVRISMRSTAASGTELRSALLPVNGAVGARRPSISTKVRLEPRPRRSMSAPAWAEEPDCGRKLPAELKVTSRMTSATETRPLACSCSREITVMGTAPSMSARLMREPVTSTVSSVVVSSSFCCSCAKAGAASTEAAPANSAKRIAPDSCLVFNMDSLSKDQS